MHDASVDRLSRIISDPRQDTGDSGGNKRLQPRSLLSHLHLGLAEGWFSLFLLVMLVYSTIWSVQAADWVDHLSILTVTTGLGLLIGVVAAKQRSWPRWLVHPLVVIGGLLLAFWQTAGADYNGNLPALLNGMRTWVALALNGGTSNDYSIFLFLIIALGFILAYTSAWLLYRTRSPWLLILANAVVLLINLNNIDPGYIVFLVVFLVAALLLLLRFNLYESSIKWRRMGLRTSDDLGWEFMQAGAMVSIGILVLTWILPWGYINDTAAQIWNADNNPWVAVENGWNRLVAVTGGYNPQNHGSFADTLTLGGNPNLTNDPVFLVTSSNGTQYLESLSYDTYDGRSWSNSSSDSFAVKIGNTSYDYSIALQPVQQQIKVVNPPGEQNAYLLGAPQLASTDQPVQVVVRKSDGSTITWLRTNGKLAAGDQYSVTSYISAADVASLETVPLPIDAPAFTPNPNIPEPPPPGYFDPSILHTYLQLPANLDIRIKILAARITAGAKTMYDKVVALENYLRDNFTYDTNINLPPGQEGVSWFLFNSGSRGFCNYFATAMAIMARDIGIPARVVAGYTNGTYDSQTKQWIIRGSDAHAWPQVYFAQYGWINFEPSATFSTFTRPLQTNNSVPTVVPGGSTSVAGGKTQKPRQDPNLQTDTGSSLVGTGGTIAVQVGKDVGLALLALALIILGGLLYFGFWWRRLYRGYGLSAQVFGRMSMLANLAGIVPRRSQTPLEYVQNLSENVPDSAVTIERLGDIYVRDRWADPSGAEHPRHTGEINEMPSLWRSLQPRLFLYALRHPHFLRKIPDSIAARIGRRRARRKRRKDDLAL